MSMSKVYQQPFVDPLADPAGDDDDDEFKAAPTPSSYKVLGSQGAFPPSGGIPKLNLDMGASLLDDSLGSGSGGKGNSINSSSEQQGAAAASVVTSLLDHRPLSQNLYKAYGSTGGDLDALTDEQRQEVVHSQAARLARVRPYAHTPIRLYANAPLTSKSFNQRGRRLSIVNAHLLIICVF
jgi:hypothetical protein